MSGPAGDGDRDVVLVLHPESPLVQVGAARDITTVATAGEDPPPWVAVLEIVRRVVPAGAWPLGPHCRVPGYRVQVLEARGPSTAGGARWSAAPDPSWPAPLREVVRSVLDEDAGRRAVPVRRAPWMRRGWWQEVTAWVDARLAAVGQHRTGDLQPQEHWGVSAVARVPAVGGALWLKAVSPIFRREPAILGVLAAHLPGRVPNVVAAQESPVGARYLVTDAGPVPELVADGDPVRLAGLIADLQVRTQDSLLALRSAGCADRSPAALCAGLAAVVEDGVELHLLDPTERAALRRCVPQLRERLLALADGPLPETLVHGDFHPWNVARPARWSFADAVVIDWTDAAIGPGGLDLATLLPRSADGDARAQVRRAYASVWAAELGAQLHDVEDAVTATTPAAHVLQALAYDEILRDIEPAVQWQLSGAMAAHLRALAEPGPR